jgi:trans-2,3-dihydro-3-hydroxyanthranilate isomerase
VKQAGDSLVGRLTVDQAPVIHRDNASVADTAAALGVAAQEVVQVFAATLGINFTFVQLCDAASVDRAKLDHAAWANAFGGRVDGQLYVFSGDLVDGGRIHSRLFAPAFGIPEDPATGSAASILAGAAAILTGFDEPALHLSIDQGVAMGRPSRLESAARLEQGQVTAVEVGGAVTFVAEGTITIPAAYLLG